MAIVKTASGIKSTANTLNPNVTVNVSASANRIVVCIMSKAGESITSITDTIGNSYGPHNDSLISSPGAAIWSAKNTGSNASNIITVNSTPGDYVIAAYVFTGIDESSPTGDSGFGNGTGTLATTGSSLTTIYDNSVIVSAFVNDSQKNFTSFGSGQGNILNADLSTPDNLEGSTSLEWKTTAGADTQTATMGKSGTWRVVSTEFKETVTATTYTATHTSDTFLQSVDQTVSHTSDSYLSVSIGGTIAVTGTAVTNSTGFESNPSVTISVATDDEVIVVQISSDTGTTFNSVSDTIGNTYAEAIGTSQCSIWWAYNTGSNASNVITVSTGGSRFTTGAMTLTGVKTSSPVGNTTSNTGSSTSLTSSTYSSGTDNSLIVAGFQQDLNKTWNTAGTGQAVQWAYANNTGGILWGGACTTESTTTAGSNIQTYELSASSSWDVVVAEILVGAGGVQYTNTAEHTSDSYLEAATSSNTVVHTSDSFLQTVDNTVVHTSDGLLQIVDNTVVHTSDSLLQVTDKTVVHTSDSFLQTIDNTVVHTSDSYLEAAGVSKTKTHTSDSFLQTVDNTVVHTSDGLLQVVDNTVVHTSDGLLQVTDKTVVHTSDGLLQIVDNTVVHTSDGYLLRTVTASHTSDALLKGTLTATHTASIRLVNETSVHATQLIRDAVVTLVTGLTTTGSNVFKSRVYPLNNSSLPSLSVYTVDEFLVELLGITKQLRELSVTIEIHAKVNSNLDKTLDTISAEVETALASDRSLGVGVVDSYFSTFVVELSSEVEKPIGVGTLTWTVLYVVDSTDVTVIL